MRAADRSRAVVQVLEGHVPFRGAVHLDHARNAEALDEGRPDVRPEPGPGRDTQPVLAVAGRGGLAQQVAAELAHVDERDGLVPPDVVQEGRGAERAT
jgi:hypothetical protein